MSKTPIIVVDSGELYLLGKLISRHHEFPWLFSITDVYKACEKSIKREAVRKGKSPETYFKSREPGQWLRTKDEHAIKRSATSTRKRLAKYGIYCGFGTENIDVRRRTKTDARSLASVSNRDLCIQIKKGGSIKGAVKVVQGIYVAQDLIVDYIDFLQLPELSSEYHTLFPTSSEAIVKTIKQHTKSRAELEFSKYLHAAAKVHGCELITQKTELDKYRVDFIFYSKRRQAAWLIEFDEDHHKYQTEEDSVRWNEIRERYSKFTRKPSNGFYFVRVSEGQHEEFLINFLTYLITGNFNKLNFIHVN